MQILPLLPPLTAYVCAMISPGQNFLVVAYTSVNANQKLAHFTACGIATGSFFYACISMFGIASLINQQPFFYNLIFYCAAGYLCYIGVKIWRRANETMEIALTNIKLTPYQSYLQGLLTNLSNPKSILFFASIFTLYLPHTITLEQRWVTVLAVLGLSLSWHNVLASLFAQYKFRQYYMRSKPIIDRVIGSVFVLLSAFLVI